MRQAMAKGGTAKIPRLRIFCGKYPALASEQEDLSLRARFAFLRDFPGLIMIKDWI